MDLLPVIPFSFDIWNVVLGIWSRRFQILLVFLLYVCVCFISFFSPRSKCCYDWTSAPDGKTIYNIKYANAFHTERQEMKKKKELTDGRYTNHCTYLVIQLKGTKDSEKRKRELSTYTQSNRHQWMLNKRETRACYVVQHVKCENSALMQVHMRAS